MSRKNKLYLGDCIEVLKDIKTHSIDVIFADPPYNLQLEKTLYRPNKTKVEGVQDISWDKFSSFKDYDEFSKKWLQEAKRVLKPNGTIWIIGTYHNIFRLGKILQDLDFWILNDVIWAKTNPMPNFKGTRFTNAHETMIWASYNKKSQYYFNYRSMKAFNDDKQMSSLWQINICSGKERMKEEGKTLHPTQKPQELLLRILLSSSKEGDTVLDPFLGTGTTGATAKLLKRNFIGIEQNEIYYNVAKARINQVKELDSNLIQISNAKAVRRTSIAKLINEGFLDKEDILCDKNQNHKAKIALDGSLILQNNICGSIHNVAEIINKRRLNGWDFWYVKKGNKLISINEIRKEYFKSIEKNT